MTKSIMSRRVFAAGIAVFSSVLALSLAAAPRQGVRGHANITGPDGVAGTADFREVDAQTAGDHDMKYMTGMKAVEMTVTVSGLKAGTHGMHLHAVGKCEAPGFTTAAGHFDPGPGGNGDPDANHPYHMGDLPNLVASTAGKATVKAITTRVTLGDGPLSLFDADGTAIIIHGNPDQGVTGEPKSGLSGGPRVACGVVNKR